MLGHNSHNIKCGSRGCPNCGVGFCYKCLSSEIENKRDRGHESNCQCPSGYWAAYCLPIQSSSDISAYIAINDGGIPFDNRCGCIICSDCRNGQPCYDCDGNCSVCKGYINPSPNEIINTNNEEMKWKA